MQPVKLSELVRAARRRKGSKHDAIIKAALEMADDEALPLDVRARSAAGTFSRLLYGKPLRVIQRNNKAYLVKKIQ